MNGDIIGNHLRTSPLSDNPVWLSMLLEAMLNGLEASLEVARKGRRSTE